MVAAPPVHWTPTSAELALICSAADATGHRATGRSQLGRDATEQAVDKLVDRCLRAGSEPPQHPRAWVRKVTRRCVVRRAKRKDPTMVSTQTLEEIVASGSDPVRVRREGVATPMHRADVSDEQGEELRARLKELLQARIAA